MILNRNISGGLAAIIIIIFTLAALAAIGYSLLLPKPMARTGQAITK